jgi:hypothetical protein
MTRRLASVIVLTAWAAVALAQAEAPLVFVLAGQSNMVGQGDPAELDEDLKRQPPGVAFYLAGVPSDLAAQRTFGPEVSLAEELSRAIPDRELVIIKYALGGTSLLAWAPEWTPEAAEVTDNAQAGPLYRNLLDQIRTITGDRTVEFGAVFWMQGERDARYPAAAADYGSNLTGLIQRLRDDLAAPTLPFIYGQVNPPAEAFAGRDAVRSAQIDVSRTVPGAMLVPTDDLTKQPDDLHYDTGGLLALGRRFAAIYRSLRRGLTVGRN